MHPTPGLTQCALNKWALMRIYLEIGIMYIICKVYTIIFCACVVAWTMIGMDHSSW